MSLKSYAYLPNDLRELAQKRQKALESLYRRDPLRACRQALKVTRDVPDRHRLAVCDVLLGGFGTEAIRGEWQNGYWADVLAEYVNMGDTYAPTVICTRTDGGGCRWWVGDLEALAGWAERHGGK